MSTDSNPNTTTSVALSSPLLQDGQEITQSRHLDTRTSNEEIASIVVTRHRKEIDKAKKKYNDKLRKTRSDLSGLDRKLRDLLSMKEKDASPSAPRIDCSDCTFKLDVRFSERRINFDPEKPKPESYAITDYFDILRPDMETPALTRFSVSEVSQPPEDVDSLRGEIEKLAQTRDTIQEHVNYLTQEHAKLPERREEAVAQLAQNHLESTDTGKSLLENLDKIDTSAYELNDDLG